MRQFRELDDQARALAASQVLHALAHDLPKPHEVPRKSELGLLRHQMELQRPSKSIREMISAMPEAFGKLAPCLLMSPLSIAQYLPADQAQFDVVIFDEASQITTWDAVGSIARGRQTIIVGDPKAAAADQLLRPVRRWRRCAGDRGLRARPRKHSRRGQGLRAAGHAARLALPQPARIADRVLQLALLSEPAGDVPLAGHRRSGGPAGAYHVGHL